MGVVREYFVMTIGILLYTFAWIACILPAHGTGGGALSGDSQPEWMPPPSGAAPSPPPGYVVSFVSFHERGFGVPASRFMRAILHVYGVELHNLSPNSISQAAIFAAVCEGYLGIDPHWDPSESAVLPITPFRIT